MTFQPSQRCWWDSPPPECRCQARVLSRTGSCSTQTACCMRGHSGAQSRPGSVITVSCYLWTPHLHIIWELHMAQSPALVTQLHQCGGAQGGGLHYQHPQVRQGLTLIPSLLETCSWSVDVWAYLPWWRVRGPWRARRLSPTPLSSRLRRRTPQGDTRSRRGGPQMMMLYWLKTSKQNNDMLQ